MRKAYVIVAALVVAVVVALGTFAATSSARLGLSSGSSSSSAQSVNAIVARGNRRLDATQAALNNALAQRPPAVNGGSVPFVAPHPIVVNVTGSAGAVPYTPQPAAHFDDEGGHGD